MSFPNGGKQVDNLVVCMFSIAGGSRAGSQRVPNASVSMLHSDTSELKCKKEVNERCRLT